MKQKPYYPIFLDISGSGCLVVGAGEVGCRKISGLLRAEPHSILVIDPNPSPAFEPLLRHTAVQLCRRDFSPEDLTGKSLVFAATADGHVNARITALCREQHILCNCVDSPADGSFIVPALAASGRLAAALSTGGASPASARIWRKELEEWLAPRAALVEILGRLRPLVLALQKNTVHNTQLFRSIADSLLQQHLIRGDRAACEQLLSELLPPALRGHITELLHDLI